MIFVTVGSQMPFDRLIGAMDRWAQANPDQEVTAQIGNTALVPKAMQFEKNLLPAEFLLRVKGASIVVAHAGMGTVISAADHGKPLVLMPRRGGLSETRNDHQVATVRWLMNRRGIFVADNEADLPRQMQCALVSNDAPNRDPGAAERMISGLRSILSTL